MSIAAFLVKAIKKLCVFAMHLWRAVCFFKVVINLTLSLCFPTVHSKSDHVVRFPRTSRLQPLEQSVVSRSNGKFHRQRRTAAAFPIYLPALLSHSALLRQVYFALFFFYSSFSYSVLVPEGYLYLYFFYSSTFMLSYVLYFSTLFFCEVRSYFNNAPLLLFKVLL